MQQHFIPYIYCRSHANNNNKSGRCFFIGRMQRYKPPGDKQGKRNKPHHYCEYGLCILHGCQIHLVLQTIHIGQHNLVEFGERQKTKKEKNGAKQDDGDYERGKLHILMAMKLVFYVEGGNDFTL